MKKFSMVVVMLMITLVITACGGGSSDSPDPSGSVSLMGGAMQGRALSLENRVSTFAGSVATYGAVEGVPLSNPNGIASDGTNLYVADADNHIIRKVVIATGAVTTIAGKAGEPGATDGAGAAARFDSPAGITTDGIHLFVADRSSNTVRKIVISTGAVTTIAGKAGVYGAADGTGAAASFADPEGITTDGTHLFVADRSSNTIRKIVISTGEVTTIAGNARSSGAVDGTGAAARFFLPCGIIAVGGNLFVTDANNELIRKIVIATGQVTTLAGTPEGTGSEDGIGAAARFFSPFGIASDGVNLFVSEERNSTIRKIVISTGEVTTIAGTARRLGAVDGTGAAARFTRPSAVVAVGGNLFVSDSGNNLVRKVDLSTALVTTLAGTVYVKGATDGIGAAASFSKPYGMTSDGANLFIADSSNNIIRKVVISTGAVTTIAGKAGESGATDGTGAAARFDYPSGITTDGANLYVTDMHSNTVRKIVISTGGVTTLAGTAWTSGAVDGTGAAARFNGPIAITTDGANLFIADSSHTIRKIVISTGAVTTIAGTAGQTGAADGTGAAARFFYPFGITTDGVSLFVSDAFNQTIRKVVISSGVVTTVAGTAGAFGVDDGAGAAAKFGTPTGITTDGTSLYVSDAGNSNIRRVDLSTGAVTTVAGAAFVKGWTDGVGAAAYFDFPLGLTTDGASLFVADGASNIIRKIR